MGDAVLVATKATAYGATLGAAGGVCFLAYSHALIGASHGARIRRLTAVLLLTSAIASAAKICAAADSMSGDLTGMFDAELTGMILQTGEGVASGVRLAGLVLMISALTPRRPPLLAGIGALAAATSFACSGHVHALSAAVPTLLLSVHLLGVAFWVGALIPLHIVAGDRDLSRVAVTTARFGNAALWVVGTMLSAGVVLLLLLGRGSALWSSGYGRGFVVKILLAALLLALAAFNHFRLTPRLIARDPRAAIALRQSIRFELSLAALIMVVTAALTTLTGPPAAA